MSTPNPPAARENYTHTHTRVHVYRYVCITVDYERTHQQQRRVHLSSSSSYCSPSICIFLSLSLSCVMSLVAAPHPPLPRTSPLNSFFPSSLATNKYTLQSSNLSRINLERTSIYNNNNNATTLRGAVRRRWAKPCRCGVRCCCYCSSSVRRGSSWSLPACCCCCLPPSTPPDSRTIMISVYPLPVLYLSFSLPLALSFCYLYTCGVYFTLHDARTTLSFVCITSRSAMRCMYNRKAVASPAHPQRASSTPRLATEVGDG